MFRNTVLLLVVTVAIPVLDAADWPAWRGPTGQGFSEEQDVRMGRRSSRQTQGRCRTG